MVPTLNVQEREQVVSELIFNSTDCCWNENDRDTLLSLPDMALALLHQQQRDPVTKRAIIEHYRPALVANAGGLFDAIPTTGEPGLPLPSMNFDAQADGDVAPYSDPNYGDGRGFIPGFSAVQHMPIENEEDDEDEESGDSGQSGESDGGNNAY